MQKQTHCSCAEILDKTGSKELGHVQKECDKCDWQTELCGFWVHPTKAEYADQIREKVYSLSVTKNVWSPFPAPHSLSGTSGYDGVVIKTFLSVFLYCQRGVDLAAAQMSGFVGWPSVEMDAFRLMEFDGDAVR